MTAITEAVDSSGGPYPLVIQPATGVSPVESQLPYDALVLFGASGVLARKMLFPALCQLVGRGRLEMLAIGVALSSWDDAELREHASQAGAYQVPTHEYEPGSWGPASADRLVPGGWHNPE